MPRNSHMTSEAATRALGLFMNGLERAIEISTTYPTVNAIFLVVRNHESTLREDSFCKALQTSVDRFRLYHPRLPAEILLVSQNIEREIGKQDVNIHAMHLLAILWSTIKNVCLNQRIELLQSDKTHVLSFVKFHSIPHAKVQQINVALDMVYMTQRALLEEKYETVQRNIEDTLFPESIPRAQLVPYISGDDATMGLPNFLRTQLLNFTQHRDIDSVFPSSSTATAWSTPQAGVNAVKQSAKVQTSPTLQKSSWDIFSSVNKAATDDVKRVSIPRPPVPVDEVRPEQLQDIKLRALTQRTTLTAEQTRVIPEEFAHFRDLIQREEHILVTRSLWVHGLRPITGVGSALMDKEATIAEARRIVSMLGNITECVVTPDENRYYRNGLILDMNFMVKFYDSIWDSNRNAMLLQLQHQGIFGTSASMATSNSPTVFPMVQRIVSITPGPDKTYTIYTVQAITESIAEKVLHTSHTLACIRGIPTALQCHVVTASCILGAQEYIRKVLLSKGIVDSQGLHDTVFAIVVVSMSHFTQEFKRSSVTGKASRTFRIPTRPDGMPQDYRPHVSLPKDIHRVEELMLEVVWLEEIDNIYGLLYNQLKKDFDISPLVHWNIGGIPLELRGNMKLCKMNRSLHPHTYCRLSISTIAVIRPFLALRDVIYALSRDPTYWRSLCPLLHGIYTLSAARNADSTPCSWLLLFIWNGPNKALQKSFLSQLAATSSTGDLLTLLDSPYRDHLGRDKFLALSEGYKRANSKLVGTKTSSKQSTKKDGKQSTLAKKVISRNSFQSPQQYHPTYNIPMFPDHSENQAGIDDQSEAISQSTNIDSGRSSPIIQYRPEMTTQEEHQTAVSLSNLPERIPQLKSDTSGRMKDEEDMELDYAEDDNLVENSEDDDDGDSLNLDESLLSIIPSNVQSINDISDEQLQQITESHPALQFIHRMIESSLKISSSVTQQRLEETSRELVNTNETTAALSIQLNNLAIATEASLKHQNDIISSMAQQQTMQQIYNMVKDYNQLRDEHARIVDERQDLLDMTQTAESLNSSQERKLKSMENLMLRKGVAITHLRQQIEEQCAKVQANITDFISADDL